MPQSDSIRDEKIRTLYAQTGPVLWANLIISLLVSVGLWQVTSHGLLIGWNSAIALMVLVRTEMRRRQSRSSARGESQSAWARPFIVASACAGLLWGVGSALIYDSGNALSQLLVVFAVGGMTAAAAGTLACYLPAFFAYLSCAMLPLTLRVLADGDLPHLAMGAMLLIYTLFMHRVATTNHRSIEQAFLLAFEKVELSERLAQAQSTLEEANRTLEQRVVARTLELERQTEALRDAQRMEAVGRLAGGIAHDFNNLLTVVLSNSSILRAEAPRSPEEGQILQETQAAAERGADLVRQLLAFSRRQQMEKRVIDVNQLLAGLEPLLRRLIGAHIVLEVEQHKAPVLVRVDPTQLEQVVVNLVANARDAMPTGGKLRATATLVEAPAESELAPGVYGVVSVSDTGVGMDADTIKHAFEPFFTTKGLGLGTGLGLATVYGIVQQSGGQVRVESRPGQGSVFRVYLPQSAEAMSAVNLPERARHATPRPATVLVAEDDPAVRAAIQRSLRGVGHRVLLAEDGKRALDLSRSYVDTIDLLITDVVMPNLNGGELSRQLLLERPGIRVLFTSGYSWGESLPPSDPSKGTDYLHKPFDTHTLRTKVAELLSGSRRERSEPSAAAAREIRGT
ncbi:MAG: ATP-binding protein [Polyangiaceae bacterium]